MQTIYSVGSVSNAMRGKRLLEKQGIRAYVRRMEADDQNGCGYALLLPQPSPTAASVLRAGGVRILKVQGRESP